MAQHLQLRAPHEALGLETPITRYHPSHRSFPGHLPDIAYWPGDAVRKVDSDGFISFKNRSLRIGKAFRRQAGRLARYRWPMASST